jgi:hypothetical protein
LRRPHPGSQEHGARLGAGEDRIVRDVVDDEALPGRHRGAARGRVVLDRPEELEGLRAESPMNRRLQTARPDVAELDVAHVGFRDLHPSVEDLEERVAQLALRDQARAQVGEQRQRGHLVRQFIASRLGFRRALTQGRLAGVDLRGGVVQRRGCGRELDDGRCRPGARAAAARQRVRGSREGHGGARDPPAEQ